MSGAVSYYAGLTAEGIVARQYRDRGFQIVANRWRGCAGEIDLIVTDGADPRLCHGLSRRKSKRHSSRFIPAC